MPPLPPHNNSDENISVEVCSEADIRKAIQVLVKAKLLSPSKHQLLLKLAEAAKDSSGNMDVMLQGLSFSLRRKKRAGKEENNENEMGLLELLNCSDVGSSVNYSPEVSLDFDEKPPLRKPRKSDYHATGSTRGSQYWKSQNGLNSREMSHVV